MLGLYVVFAAAAVILIFLWHHRRDRQDIEQPGHDPHGHGLGDEVATAVEDVARQVIEPDGR